MDIGALQKLFKTVVKILASYKLAYRGRMRNAVTAAAKPTVAKYISKNIDDYAIDADVEGLEAKSSSEHVTAGVST